MPRRAALAVLFAVLLAASLPASAQQPSQGRESSREPSAAFRALAARADAARDAQQLPAAVLLYRKALALDPAWAEGWWSLGTIDYDASRYRQAAADFRRLTLLRPRQGTAFAMLGLCQFELHQDADALRQIELAKNLGVIQDSQLRDVVLYHEGVLLQRAGRFQAAQAPLSSLCLGGVKSVDLVRTFGMVALRSSNPSPPAQGTPQLEVVERVGLGACLAGQKDYKDARQVFDETLRKFPRYPNLHYAYGRVLLDAKDRAAAIGQFRQEIAISPADVLPRLQIAAADYKVDSPSGIPWVRQAVSMAPRMGFAHYLLGLLLLDTGDFRGAIPQLEIAARAYPGEAPIFWSLGVAYAHQGRPQDAARARAEFARLSQSSAAAQNGAGNPPPAAAPAISVPMPDHPGTTH